MSSRLARKLIVLVSFLAVVGAPAAAQAQKAEPTDRAAARATSCFQWNSAVATYGSYSAPSRSGCYVFGSPGLRMGYSWSVPSANNGRLCVQVKSINSTGTTVWVNAGCGRSGAVTVAWGNYSGYPAARAKVQPGFFGGPYSWRQ